jgi:hypothetical protein
MKAKSVSKKKSNNPKGRPPSLIDGAYHKIYIDAESWALAQSLGDGNASEGLRVALAVVQTLNKVRK